MKHIWLLLIWILIVATESLLYSAIILATSAEHCSPFDLDQNWKDLIETLDRIINYQSWFVPLIWLYWPTTARK